MSINTLHKGDYNDYDDEEEEEEEEDDVNNNNNNIICRILGFVACSYHINCPEVF